MILTDNRILLKEEFSSLYANLKNYERNEKSQIKVELARNSFPTLKFVNEETEVYIHSKYNPQNESLTFSDQFNDLKGFNHILFVGTGFGYHIQNILQKNKVISFL